MYEPCEVEEDEGCDADCCAGHVHFPDSLREGLAFDSGLGVLRIGDGDVGHKGDAEKCYGEGEEGPYLQISSSDMWLGG